MPSLILFGAHGQLGQCLAETALPAGWRLEAVPRARADITDAAAVAAALAACPDGGAVVNAAAYTAVDKAESEPEAAFAINRDGAAHVAAAAAAAGLPLIHISTDYVYDGEKRSPYQEDDAVAPRSVYGASKLAGEQAVRAATPRHVILRTAWLFSPHGHNFLKTMLRLGQERDRLTVVDDQTGCPTAATDLAAAIAALAPRLAADRGFGTFHYAGDDPVTWCGFARAILAGAARRGRRVAEVAAIPGSAYPTPACRPAYSVLSCRRLLETHGIAPSDWRAALDRHLDRLL